MIYHTELKQLLVREPDLFSALVPFLLKYQKPPVDAIAVTAGPGLEPALWVGINFAKALSLTWNVPLVAVNHMEGHVIMSLTNFRHPSLLQKTSIEGAMAQFEFPVLTLLISGGHTELVLMKGFGRYKYVGRTRDDAAGEAFDKVARLMGLGYPGGPAISRLAAEARKRNSKGDFSFTRPMLHEDNFDFSFSGLKTAARTIIGSRELTDELKMQVAREFEECVAGVLVGKTMRAVDEFGANTVVIGGGVSANVYIRSHFAQKLADEGNVVKLLTPPPEFATDNALMIALAGYFHARKKEFADSETLTAQGNLKLGHA